MRPLTTGQKSKIWNKVNQNRRDRPEPTSLRERVGESDAACVCVDRTNRLVGNVAITGAVSRNGYRYAAEALEAAAPLYVGRPVFLDHSQDPNSPQSRSTRDLVGTVVSARFVATADGLGLIRGDIRVLDTESGRTFLTLCESDEPGVGMSHVVLARRSEDGSVVESIEKVISVDAVMFPATTNRLSESETTLEDESFESQSRSSEGDCRQRTCGSCATCQEKVAELERECEQLRGNVSRLKQARVVAERDMLLASSGLPTSAISDLFRRLVHEAETKDLARQLIQDRLAMLTSRRGPMSEPRDEEHVEAVATLRFVDAVKAGK